MSPGREAEKGTTSATLRMFRSHGGSSSKPIRVERKSVWCDSAAAHTPKFEYLLRYMSVAGCVQCGGCRACFALGRRRCWQCGWQCGLEGRQLEGQWAAGWAAAELVVHDVQQFEEIRTHTELPSLPSGAARC